MGATIEECKKEYAAARERGDAVGMKAANDAANAIRASQGIAAERATADIQLVREQAASRGNTTTTVSSGGGTSSGSSVAQSTPKVNNPWESGVDDNGKVDVGVQLQKAMDAGAPVETIKELVEARKQKIAADDSLGIYDHDSIFDEAEAYIQYHSKPTEEPAVDTYDQTPSKSGSSSSASKYDLSGVGTQQIAAQVESQLAGLRGAYEKGMQAYDAELDDLPQRYQAAKNDVAAQSAMAKKNFDEQANAVGLNSGTSGQAALDASATYRGALARLNQAQAGDAAEIDRAKALLTAEYEQAIAQAVADGDAAKAELKFNELLRVQGLLREDEQIAYNRAQAEKQWDYAVEQDALDREERKALQEYEQAQIEYANKLDQAVRLAQYGIYSGYAELWGLSEDVVQALVEQYAEAERLTKEEAARQLAAWHAQFGDFSKLKELGVDTTMLEKSQW